MTNEVFSEEVHFWMYCIFFKGGLYRYWGNSAASEDLFCIQINRATNPVFVNFVKRIGSLNVLKGLWLFLFSFLDQDSK